MTKDIAADLERLICDLADIGNSSDVDARRKARRIYSEMRLKYPVSVQDAVEPTYQSGSAAAASYADAHAPVIPNHRALVKTAVAEAYLAGMTARAAAEPRADQWTPEQMAEFRARQAQNICQGCLRPVSACVCSLMGRT